MSRLHLHDPLWLLALPALLALFWWQRRSARSSVAVYSSVELLRGLPRTAAQRVRSLLPILRFAGLALIVVALARPRLGSEEFRIRREGIAIMVALDRSNSMAALDFEERGQLQTRLQAAKTVLRDFVDGGAGLPGRPDDLIGLIAFGGFAEGRAPLTLDHGALLDVLGTVELPAASSPLEQQQAQLVDRQVFEEEGATAIGDALALGVERVRRSPARSRILVLLSDGENTAGVVDPLEAADLAAAHGVKVYTIGVGSTGPAPFQVRDRAGRQKLVRQIVRLDEVTLEAIADRTGGRYFNARDTEALRAVYEQIDRLEKTEIEGGVFTHYSEKFQFALLPGCALLALVLLLQATRLRTLP